MGKRWKSNRNDSGSMLAAIFIVALGAGTCLFTVAAMSPASLPMAMLVIGGISGAFMVFVILQRFGKLPATDLSFLLSSSRNRRDDGLTDYEPKLVKSKQTPVAGVNRPISAAEAHEIKVTSANTWVPAPTKKRN
jgi:hypothetical protein